MRLATTAVLAATALALGAAIHRVDHQPTAGKRAADLAKVLVRFEPDGIDRIVVERGVAKTVLAKREGTWFFAEPEEDRVDPTLAVALLDRLNHLGIVDDLGKSGDLPEATPLGLEGDRAIRVTISGPGGEGESKVQETLVLGLEAPRTGSIYARREGSSAGTFVVDGNLRPWLESPLQSLRDRKLLSAPVGAVVQLVIRQASGEIALQRRIVPPQQDWALSAPLVSWADREAMDRLLTAIGKLQIEEVAKEASVSEEIPNPLPEGAAVLQMQIYGIPQPLVIYLRQVAESEEGSPVLEARVSDRPVVYRLKSDFLATALPASPNDLRDRTLARLPLEYMDSIKIQSIVDPLVDLRAERNGPNVSWKVALNSKLVPANSAEVNGLVATVNEAAIQKFVSDDATDLAPYGLQPPQRRILFHLKLPGEPAADGSAGPVRDLVRTLNLGWKEDEAHRLYAHFDGEPHIYELDPTFLNRIPTHPVKWKSLNVLTFNPMHLKSITREMPEKEMLKLDYYYREDRWEASRNGVDVTPSLDVASARRLRDRLGSLSATGWYLSLGAAYEALNTPSATFKIVAVELDRATNESKETTYLLKLAPSATNVYFGQIAKLMPSVASIDPELTEGSPDVFFLDHDTYRDLIRPVTTSRLPAP